MINSYEEAVNYILDIPRFADKSGPENVKRLMKLLGHPENEFASIHIAGTNGKGSVARILAGTFYEAGYKTGLFVSPHLVRINERISINGADISDGDFLDCYNKVLDASEKLCEEMEGILLWALAGLLRLVKNNFQFTESGRARLNREIVKKDANNIELFLES